MAYFNDEQDVYRYLGGVFRLADEQPEVGPKLRAANITLQLNYSDPAASLTVRFQDPVEVVDGGQDEDADVKLSMPADVANKYWRGEYNLAVGMAKGKVKAKGPVNKILKLVPLCKPLFPVYREMVADKDAAAVA